MTRFLVFIAILGCAWSGEKALAQDGELEDIHSELRRISEIVDPEVRLEEFDSLAKKLNPKQAQGEANGLNIRLGRPQPSLAQPLHSSSSPAKLPIAGGELWVWLGQSAVWVIPGAKNPVLEDFIEVYYKEENVVVEGKFDSSLAQELDTGFFPSVGGVPTELVIKSSDTSVFELVTKSSGEFGIKVNSPGEAEFLFKLGDDEVRISFTVFPLPVNIGDTQKEVVRKLKALPDLKLVKTDQMGWFKPKGDYFGRFDGWFYLSYPGTFFSFENDKLKEVGLATTYLSSWHRWKGFHFFSSEFLKPESRITLPAPHWWRVEALRDYYEWRLP